MNLIKLDDMLIMIKKFASPFFLIVTLIFGASLLSGCFNKELDRATAQDKILSDEKITELQHALVLTSEGYERGESLGWWSNQSFRKEALTGGLGEEFSEFVSIKGFRNAVKTKSLAKIEIEVTGVVNSVDEASAIAEFDWRYKDLMPLQGAVAVKGGSGRALFTRFDDGWRLSGDVNLSASVEGYQMSESDKVALEKSVDEIREYERLAREKAEQERLKRVANADRSLVGTWTFDEGYTKYLYSADQTYQYFIKRGATYVIFSIGRWRIDGDRLILDQSMKEGLDAQLHPNSFSSSYLILDISNLEYRLTDTQQGYWLAKRIN